MAFLDTAGLERLWQQIIAKLGTKADASSLEDGSITVAEATHATSADTAANATTATSATSATSATKDSKGNVIADTYETKADADETEASLTALINGKAASSHTHTIANVTNLQSSLDAKVPTSRTVNGKALSSNITLSSSDVGAAASSHTHSDLATVTDLDEHIDDADVHITSAERTKLDGIAAGAQVNTITGVKGNSESTYRTGNVNITAANIGLGNVNNTSDANKPVSTAQQAAIDEAEASALADAKTYADGLNTAMDSRMDAAESKLSGIADGANKTTVDSALSSTSTNPVQNKVINSALSGKVPTSRTVNGKALSANITLSASDVGADASGAASDALDSAKAYTDAEIANLLENSTEAVDSIYELRDAMNDNSDAITALESIAASKASASDLTSHTGNTTVHITSTERTNWNAAYTHSQAAHAPSNAEKNQNAFSNVTVGSTTIEADSATDTITLVGSNVTLTPDATNDKVTIGITKANVTSALGYTPPTTNTTYSVATTSANGLMSSTDKSKLDGIAAGAEVNQNAFANVKVGDTTIAADAESDTLTFIAGSNVTLTPSADNDSVTIAAKDTVYTHPSYTARTGVPTANQTPAFGGTFSVTQPVSDASGHITAMNSRTVTIPSTAATTSAAGLMSAADKTKLDGIATSANNYSLPAATSSALGGVKIGSNITNSSGTISLTKDNVVAALGYTPPTSDTNTDTKVTQTVTTSNAVYPLLLAPNAQTATTTTTTYFDSGVTLNPSTNTIAANVSGSSASCTGNAATATTATKLGSSTLGSTTQPVYLSSGTATKCSTYAGGTAVTLNNSSKAASTASFYAPTAGGTSGYVLTGAGTTSAPTWTAQSSLSVGSATSATTAGTCTGNSATATKLATARTISLTGDAAGSASFDGSGDASITATVSSMHGVTTAGTGAAYTATVSGITALTAGVSFIMVPHTNSTTTTPTLNVNSLGAKGIRMRGSSATGTAMTASVTAWIASGRPVQLTYNGIYWLAETTRPAASDLSGTVAIANGGTGATTAAAALTNLGAAASDVITVSSTEPTSSTCMLWVQI